MDLTSGLLIGRVRGIAIRVHWSWIFIFTLVTWALSVGWFAQQVPEWTAQERWLAALTTAILFFVSVLLHELSHAFVALGYGMSVPSITLFIFGGVSNIAGEMETPGQEFRVAIAGPAMSAVLGFFFIGMFLVLPFANVNEIFLYLGVVNFLLAFFNLLPGFPLDGGRVFRSIVWRRTGDLTQATRIASNVGVGIAWFLIAVGILWVLFVSLFGLWYVLIGLFLKSAAESAYSQVLVERTLRGIRAVDVMRPAPSPVDEQASLEQIVEDHVLRRGERAVFLARDGRVTGLITTTDLTRVPREDLGRTRAYDAMVRADEVITVNPETSVMEAMRLMAEKDIHQVPVLDDGRMVGLLTRGDIIQQLETRMRFRDLADIAERTTFPEPQPPEERAGAAVTDFPERDEERR